MNKIFYSAFDFFTHAIPGFCIIVSLFILDSNLNTSHDFLAKANQFHIGGAVLLLVVGYIIGFGVHPIGRFFYKKIGFKIWNEKILNDVPLFISDKYILIREFSPKNFKYVETWNMFCAMAHNLAVACLLTLIFIIIKVIFIGVPNLYFWLSLGTVTLIFLFLFLHRSVRFSIWAAHEINATVDKLNLVKRGKQGSKNELL
jgi:hypothetical protein